MLKLNPKRVDFLKLLQHVGSEMSVLAASNGQKLKVELPDSLRYPGPMKTVCGRNPKPAG